MSKFGRKYKNPPDGFEFVEPTLSALETELRERVNDPHEGLRKNETSWPVHQINWQKSRYIYDLYYVHHRISREVYDYCMKNKLVDGALIAKWKKPGYERLCSTYVINPQNYKFSTVSICRVPKQSLASGTIIEDPVTGCRGCASGPGGESNIFGNKYGQHLAAIQIAREQQLEAQAEEGQYESEDGPQPDGQEEDAEDAPVEDEADLPSSKRARVDDPEETE
jgi:bud site selection protein 31